MQVPEQRAVLRHVRTADRIEDDRLPKIKKWITARDVEILRLLRDEFEYATSEMIGWKVFSWSPQGKKIAPVAQANKTNDRLRKLYQHCLIDRWFPPVGRDEGSSQQHVILDYGGALILNHIEKKYGTLENLTDREIKQAISTGNFKRPEKRFRKIRSIPQDYRHRLMIIGFRCMLDQLSAQLEGVGKVVKWQRESENKADFSHSGHNYRLIPDAFCIYRHAQGVAKIFYCEFDNNTESLDVLKEKIDKYIAFYNSQSWAGKEFQIAPTQVWRMRRFPHVLFFLRDNKKIKPLAQYVQQKAPENLHICFTCYDWLIQDERKEYESKEKTRSVRNQLKIQFLEDIWYDKSLVGRIRI